MEFPALAIQTPQQQSPLDMAAKIMQLKNMQQQAQMAPLQQQAAELEVQQREQAVKDQQASTKALMEWDGTDFDALPKLILKNGGSSTAVYGFQQQILERKAKLSQIAKEDADTGGKNLQNMATKNDMLLGHLQAVTAGPDEGLGQRLQAAAEQAVQDKLLDPQHAQVITQLTQLDPKSLREKLTILEKDFMGQKGQMEQIQAQADLEKKQADARKAKVEADTAEQYGAATSQQKENRYQSVLEKLNAHKSVSSADLEFARGYEMANRKTTTTSDSLGISSSNTSGPSGLSAAQPRKAGGGGTGKSAADSIVDLIGQYKADPATVSRMFFKHPEIMGAIQQKYPDWDQSDYNAKNKLLVSMTSGPQSKEINAINTVMGHIGVLDQAVDALKNNDIRLMNKVANRLGIEVGQTPAATFQTIVHRIGPEITTAYVQGGGGQEERFANAKDFDANLSPDILHSNAAITVKLLRSKIGALENQYKQTVKRDDFTQRFLTPEAKQSLERFGGAGGQKQGGQQPAAKVLSMAVIEKAAKDHGVSVDEAKRQAIAAGYQVQ